MGRSFRQRLAVLGVLVVVFLAIDGAARYYSPVMVAYVVEQSLVQKAPSGMSASETKERFRAAMAAVGPDGKLLKLFEISNYLEKVQKLTPADLDRLLTAPKAAGRAGF